MEMREDVGEKVSSSSQHLRDSLGVKDKLEELRQVAYHLYEKKGRLRGTEFASWLEAAQIVKSRGE
jgi:Protein of unknown function (DUF2934)